MAPLIPEAYKVVKMHCQELHVSGSVYKGQEPFGTDTKLGRISPVFTRVLVDTVRIGSAIWSLSDIKWVHLWPIKVIQYVYMELYCSSFELVPFKQSGSRVP